LEALFFLGRGVLSFLFSKRKGEKLESKKKREREVFNTTTTTTTTT
jgi:hypothetical protein